MKPILMGTGGVFLGLAALMWTTASSNGGKGHGGHGGGHAAGHAPAHVGSVHYGARPGPVHVAPVHVAPVRSGAVRIEHYPNAGGYRNPYRDEYFRRFRPGYFPFVLNGAQYYGYYSLPAACPPVVLNGITYYFCEGIYYQPYIYGGQTIYMVAPM